MDSRKPLFGGGGRKSASMKPKRISQGASMPLTESAANSRQSSAKMPQNRKSSIPAPAASSSSRLPRPSASAVKSRTSSSAQKRSASSSSATRGRKMMALGAGPGATAGSNLVTPRSVSSGARTPQRMHQNTVAGTTAARFSMGGSNTRGSAMGVKATKDSRPLSDKAWQRKAISEIIYFLNNMNYQKELSQTDFPLNSTDFKGVFDFLMKVHDPLYEIPLRKLELELPPRLKKLGYNGSLSKSSFQTLGTPHAWPSVLGVLHYLVQRATTVCMHDEQMYDRCFPNTDEDGFERDVGESEAKIFYETHMKSYRAFLNGEDEEDIKGHYLADYQDRLLINYGVSRKKMQQLQREKVSMQDDFEKLNRAPNKCQGIEERIRECRNAIKGYMDFEEKTKEYMARKKSDLSQIKGKNADKEDRARRATNEIKDATESCFQRGINPESTAAARMDTTTKDLQNQIDMKKTMQREASNRISDLEMKLSREKMEVGKTVGNLQSKLLQLGLEPEHPALTVVKSLRPQDAIGPIQTLHGELMAKSRELRQTRDATTSALDKVEQKRKAMGKETEELEILTRQLQEEIRAYEEQMEQDYAISTQKLGAMRELLFKKKSEQAGAEKIILELQGQVIAAETELKSMKEDRQMKLIEAHDKVKTGAEQVREWRIKRLKERYEMFEKYKAECMELVKEKVELTKRVHTQLEKILNTPLPDSDDEN